MRVLAVLALCAAIFFVGLSAYDLDTKGEPREGFTAWEMIHSGEWALPHLNGEVLPEKPLVFPWLVAASTLALGEGGELAPRLPSALMACALVLVVYAMGVKLRGDGVRPAVICATTALVVSLARRARVDMTLSFFVAFALLQFLRALEKPRLSTIALFWIAVALGTLTKGPIGLALPVLAAGSYLLYEKRLGAIGYVAPLYLPLVPLFLVIAGSWYANGLLREGHAFAYRTFLMENVLMFVGAKAGGGHIHGTFYYFKYFWWAAPWIVYLPAALWLAWRRRKDRASAFPLAWLASLFVFFSIARGKRADYLLPLMPAIALLVADLWRENASVLRPWSRLGALVGVGALVAYPFAKGQIPVAIPWEVFAAVLLVAIAPAVLIELDRRRAALASIAGGMSLAAMGVALTVMPTAQKTRPFAEQLGRTVGDAPFVQCGVFEYTALYYLRRHIPTVERAAAARTIEKGGFALVSREEWIALQAVTGARVAAVDSDSDRLLLAQPRR